MKISGIWLILMLLALAPAAFGQSVNGKLVPDLTSSSLISTSYDGSKISNFNISIAQADWADNGQGGLSAQLAYDLVLKQFMGCFLAWRFCPEAIVKAGQQKMMFMQEVLTSPPVLEASGYSMGMNYLGGYTRDLTGLSSRSRDWGLTLSGDLFRRDDGSGRLSYAFGVFQGNGFSIKDDNGAKNVSGLLVASPVRGLKVSVGGLLGSYDDGQDSRAARNRLSGGAFYDDGRYFLKAETVWGKTSLTESLGAFVLAGLWFRPDMAVALRADRFQRDLSMNGSAINKFDLCFNHIAGKHFRYRIQFSHTAEAGGTRTNAVSLGISLRFSTSSKH